MLGHFLSIFIRLPLLLRILIIAFAFIICFGIAISFIEPETFLTIFDGVWWAIVTAATVGYGDLVPKTILGKVTGIFLILFGVGFVSTYFVTLAKIAVTRQEDYLGGKVTFKGKKQIIIVGWNGRTREIIKKLLKNSPSTSIVLIDETLKANPLSDYHVHFIQGQTTLDSILLKANIYEADKVIITADQNKDERQADMNSILTLLTVKGLNPHVNCIVEILTTDQLANAKRAGANEIIQSNLIASSVMMSCVQSEGIMESFLDLLDLLNGSKLQTRSPNAFLSKTFPETSALLLEEGKLLLGIKRGEKTIIHPAKEFIIKENDLLLVIGNEHFN